MQALPAHSANINFFTYNGTTTRNRLELVGWNVDGDKASPILFPTPKAKEKLFYIKGGTDNGVYALDGTRYAGDIEASEAK